MPESDEIEVPKRCDYVDSNGTLRVLRGTCSTETLIDRLPVCDLLGVRFAGESPHVHPRFQYGSTYGTSIDQYPDDLGIAEQDTPGPSHA